MPTVRRKEAGERTTIQAHTTNKDVRRIATVASWWKSTGKRQLQNELLSSFEYLKRTQNHRYRQIAVFSRLYGSIPLMGVVGTNLTKVGLSGTVPIDRPTFNAIQSCSDTLVARISQSKPRAVFLTDGGDYKQRNLAKKLNAFMDGEFYRTKAYEKGEAALKDAAITGTGVVKVLEKDGLVSVERLLNTELLVDMNDGMYGEPRQMYHMKLVDRDVLAEAFPEVKGVVRLAEQAYPDNSDESGKSIADQVMVVEAWHLPSKKGAKDGRHSIVCSSGVILDEDWEKPYFPFVFLHYSSRMLGFWSQGLAEQLMGTQVEINRLLITMSQSINLVGVPRVFVEEGSKVVKSHLNNAIGAVVMYRGTKPQYEVAPCVPVELYGQLERLIDYCYKQCGISQLAANAQKPAGLDSGEAIRTYEDVFADRLTTIAQHYDKFFVELAYLITDLAKDIAKREGKYSTIYPGKLGSMQIDLAKADLAEDPVIQIFNANSLPRDPSGRLAKITEMTQAGMISITEARRLLDFADLAQVEVLANAPEERIYQTLDDIIEDGKYSPPDPFTNLQLAEQIVVQYINLYVPMKLEEKKAQMLRDYYTQIQDLKQTAMQPPPGMPMPVSGGALAGTPTAVPQPPAQSPILPNAPQS